MNTSPDPDRFADNLSRLLGLHRLSSAAAAPLLGITAATLSSWLNARATPSLHRAVLVGHLFGLNTQRLLEAPFSDLLANELSDPERFDRIEALIQDRLKDRQPRSGR